MRKTLAPLQNVTLPKSGKALQRITYQPCGCELIGEAPMPKECPTHGDIASQFTASVRQRVHVAILLDESASMNSCRSATVEGLNGYVHGLREDKDVDYVLTLIKFDRHRQEPICREIFVNLLLEEVKELTLLDFKPRGDTPLYDAIGETLPKIGGAATKYVMVIVTDGENNSSREFTDVDIKEMIAKYEKLGNWSFVYLGANQDAWAVAGKMGILRGNAANYQTSNMSATMKSVARSTSKYAVSASLSTQSFFDGNKDIPLTAEDLGSVGGKKRMASMTEEQRRQLAQSGAAARWSKNKKNKASLVVG